MSNHSHSDHTPQPGGGFWKSRTGVVLIAFLAIAGLLLAYEHRIHIFTGNGFLVGLLLACVVMHFFMHGGHGGGHGHDEGQQKRGRS